MLYTNTSYRNEYSGVNSVHLGPDIPVVTHTTFNCIGGDFARVMVYFDQTYTQPMGFTFMRILDGIGGARISEQWYRQVGSDEPETGATSEGTHYKADSDVLTAFNGGHLLDLANLFKDEFFAGVTQTPQTLFDYMVNKYGNADGFWVNNNVVSQFVWAQNQMDVCMDSSVEYDKAMCEGFNQTYPSDYNFKGLNYGVVVNTYPASADTDQKKLKYVMAKLIFTDINPEQNNALHFDVYVQGNGGPTIDVKWKAINTDKNFSLQAVRVRRWRVWEPIAFFPDSMFTTVDGIVVPNENTRHFKGNYTWSQSEHFTYLGAFQNESSDRTEPEKIAFYGTDGIANAVSEIWRFDYVEYVNSQEERTWGDCVVVHIPKDRTSDGECTAILKAGSAKSPKYSTTCTIHFTAPEDPPPGGGDNDDPPPPTPPTPDPPFPEDEPIGFPGHAILTQTYSMGETALENIGSKLWSQSYYDVLKIQNNPIENIISCKWFPMNLSGVARSVKIGNIDFQTTGTYIRENRYISSWMEYTYTGNECTWTDPEGNTYKLPKYMCCSPYTRLKLHLPYAGVVELDAADFINNKLRVRYVVDLVTGDMLYFLQCGASHAPYMTVAGKMGVDIPLTATNRAQTELAIASKTLSAVIGAAGSLATGQALGAAAYGSSIVSAVGMDMTTQRTSTQSPTCASFENLAIYLEVIFPQHKASKGFAESHGYPTNLKKKLGDCKGFTKVDSRTVIDVAMTEEENRMLEELLTNGIYV